MFDVMSYDELYLLNGGVNVDAIYAGFVSGCIGVGCFAIAMTPGLNVVAVAGVAYLGSWGIACSATATIYGFCT